MSLSYVERLRWKVVLMGPHARAPALSLSLSPLASQFSTLHFGFNTRFLKQKHKNEGKLIDLVYEARREKREQQGYLCGGVEIGV